MASISIVKVSERVQFTRHFWPNVTKVDIPLNQPG